jgi:hypothetical protein
MLLRDIPKSETQEGRAAHHKVRQLLTLAVMHQAKSSLSYRLVESSARQANNLAIVHKCLEGRQVSCQRAVGQGSRCSPHPRGSQTSL